MFPISLLKNKYDNAPKPATWDIDTLIRNLRTPKIRQKKDGAAFCPAVFDGKREKGNVIEVSLLVLDYDHCESLEDALKPWNEVYTLVYSTHSHATEEKPHAYRMVIPLARPIDAEQYPLLWNWANQLCEQQIDPACKDASRLHYLPAVPKEREEHFVFHQQQGHFLDWQALSLSATREVPKPSAPASKLIEIDKQSHRYKKMVETAINEEVRNTATAANGTRNATLNKSAYALGQLCAAAWSMPYIKESEVRDILLAAANTAGLEEKESRATINSGLKKGLEHPRDVPAEKPFRLNVRYTKQSTSTTETSEPEQAEIEEIEEEITKSFALDNKALWYVEKSDDEESKPKRHRVCAPLRILAACEDDSGMNEGRVVKFKSRRGREHTYVVKIGDLVGEPKEFMRALANRGLFIKNPQTSDTKNRLIKYINESNPRRWYTSVEMTGWHGTGNDAVFVMTGGELIGKGDVIFAGEDTNIYAQKGGLHEWQKHVAQLCVGNSRLIFSVSLAFSGVLMPLTNDDSAGVNIWGDTSTGKSTTQRVAASVWGSPISGHFVSKWNATAAGLEVESPQRNHTLYILDELGEVEPKIVGKLMYQLASGVTKTRANADVSLRSKKMWRFPFLSSAEKTLAQHIEEAGQRVYGGQMVRMVDIPAVCGQFKVFEDVHGLLEKYDGDAEAAGHAFSEYLKKTTQAYHGTAGRAFVQAIINIGLDKAKELIHQHRNAFLERLPTKMSTLARRAAKLFSLTATAGEMAVHFGILPWEAGQASDAAFTCFKAWLAETSGGNPEEAAMLAQVRLFLEQHSDRFRGWDEKEATEGGRAIPRQAGWVKHDEDGESLYFIKPEIFKKEVCARYDYKKVCDLLRNKEALLTNKGRLDFRIRKPGCVRAFVIVDKNLNSENEVVTVVTSVTNTSNTNNNNILTCDHSVSTLCPVSENEFVTTLKMSGHTSGHKSTKNYSIKTNNYNFVTDVTTVTTQKTEDRKSSENWTMIT